MQISILESLDPAVHQRIGAALRRVRAQNPNMLVVASGSITHGRGDPPLHAKDHIFFDWFKSTLADLRGDERIAAIRDAGKVAPHFRVSAAHDICGSVCVCCLCVEADCHCRCRIRARSTIFRSLWALQLLQMAPRAVCWEVAGGITWRRTQSLWKTSKV